jgi:hypothetical protein
MSTTIQDGSIVGRPDRTSQAVIAGGAVVPFHTIEELQASGYGSKPLQITPARVWDSLPTTIGDGTRIGKAGTGGEAAVIGTARVALHSAAERESIGYGQKPLITIPVRVWDALPTEIRDGTRIGKASSTAEAVTIGGARITFQSGAELVESGYGNKPMYKVPARVWDALPTEIRDGTRIGKASSTAEAVTIGGARITFQSGAELVESGYGNKPMYKVPVRVWDAIATTIGDGTYIKAPSSSDVWLVTAGRRALSDQVDGVWVIPARVMESIPID